MSVVMVNKNNFKEEVLEAETTVLVDFYAVWCGPCQRMTPIVEELAQERADIKVCKIDVDQDKELAMQYQVASIPTFLVFKNGELVNRTMGARSKTELESLL